MSRRHRNRNHKDEAAAYERLVETILASAYRVVGDVATVTVQRNAIVEGATRDELGKPISHEIDVYIEIQAPFMIHRIAVQAKRWRSKVKKEQILTFAAVLQDIPGQPRGIMVAANGYQEGALNFAKTHGIELFLLQDLDDAKPTVAHIDLSGMRAVTYRFDVIFLRGTDLVGEEIRIDFRSGLVSAYDVALGSSDRGWSKLPTIVEEYRVEFLSNLYRAAEEGPTHGTRAASLPPNTHFRLSGSPPGGVAHSLDFDFEFKREMYEHYVDVGESFEHFFSNVLTGEEWLVDRSGGAANKERMGLCDFCSVALADDQGADFGCPDIILEYPSGGENQILISDWGACDKCASDVLRGDREALITRALMIQFLRHGMINEFGLRIRHGAFWEGYTGTVNWRGRYGARMSSEP
ncbi:MAG TPA: restriction endonuclease [Candidatus Elarobacter sp.]|nr:restriction endonuclease [Candidatus Elarobacter sp.]HEV2737740.1 restriction endonuclease [Candidatus Elarobacter sp.]